MSLFSAIGREQEGAWVGRHFRVLCAALDSNCHIVEAADSNKVKLGACRVMLGACPESAGEHGRPGGRVAIAREAMRHDARSQPRWTSYSRGDRPDSRPP